MTQRELDELSADECMALLHKARVGRLVYTDDDGLAAIPVNYAISGSTILFRVEGGAKQAAMSQPLLSFEVDHIDETEQSGWSVLVRGTGREVTIEEVPDLLRAIEGPPPVPWATGIHDVWLQITPTKLTGRQFGEVHSGDLF